VKSDVQATFNISITDLTVILVLGRSAPRPHP
jgi:hypothetical protein